MDTFDDIITSENPRIGFMSASELSTDNTEWWSTSEYYEDYMDKMTTKKIEPKLGDIIEFDDNLWDVCTVEDSGYACIGIDIKGDNFAVLDDEDISMDDIRFHGANSKSKLNFAEKNDDFKVITILDDKI